MLLSLVSCSQLIFQTFCAPSLSSCPPACRVWSCKGSRLPSFLKYYSVVGIVFTCDSIPYSVYITHICYCTITVQCPHACVQHPQGLRHSHPCLLVPKTVGSCTLPIVSVSLFTFHIPSQPQQGPSTRHFFFYLLLQPKAFICLSIPGGKLQEHSQASVSHVKLDVPAPTAGCDSIAPCSRRFEKLGHICLSVTCQSLYVLMLFLLLLLDSRSSTQWHINYC